VEVVAVQEGRKYLARNTDTVRCSFVDVGATRYELDPQGHRGDRRELIIPYGVTEAALGDHVTLEPAIVVEV
jgi:hypothetical protein